MFWRSTLRELLAAIDGKLEANGQPGRRAQMKEDAEFVAWLRSLEPTRSIKGNASGGAG